MEGLQYPGTLEGDLLVSMATLDLSRFEQFLAIPTEDIAARAQFALRQSETDELHTLAVNGGVSWDLYHQVNNARKADFIYQQDGKKRDWTIAYIRKQLGHNEYRRYTCKNEQVEEWISGRLWPIAFHFYRIRWRKEPIRLIKEIEIALRPDIDLDEFWEGQQSGWTVEAIELLQSFPDNEFVHNLCFVPGDPNFEARIVISRLKDRKELTFPIALRYKPLLNKLERDRRLDITKSHPQPNQPLPCASSEELQEALLGLWQAVNDYQDSLNIPISAYIENKLKWHMGEAFKLRSTDLASSKTGKTQRVLQGRMERTGGLIDDPRYDKDEHEAGTRGDTIADPHARLPDQRILLQQIFDSLVDKIDRQIVHLYCEGQSQEEIAKKLKITQPAITQRLKRMGKRLSR